jgi:hypothetical protein
VETVRLLMPFGANAEAKSRAGKTSFDLLHRSEQAAIEEVLRKVRRTERRRTRANRAAAATLSGLPAGASLLPPSTVARL